MNVFLNRIAGLDSMGNENNLLSVPLKGAPKITRAVPGKVLNELGIVDMDSSPSTPIAQVANTAAEVADTAQMLDRVRTFGISFQYLKSFAYAPLGFGFLQYR